MKYSQLFAKTRKSIPSDATSVNHQLLLKAGFVDQLAAGIFTWMPLGLRVLRNIESIVREELNATGAQEVVMPALIPKGNWEEGGRWNGIDILFKIKSQTDKEYGLGFSHEEVVTPLAKQYIHSYKDLPLSIYQIQTKFRDELRAKSGVLRGREFGMKDMYSFHVSLDDLHEYYDKIIQTYFAIFSRMGLTEVKMTEASGGSFTKKHSHEFNVLTPAGEVDLAYCDSCPFAENTELSTHKAGEQCPSCKKGTLVVGKGIEVGNIFDLGTRFSDSFKVTFTDVDGTTKPVVMGCYGIGTTRIVGAVVELFHDDKGMMWPESIAPFKAHLISLPGGEKKAEAMYKKLVDSGVEVLWDDRTDVSAGVKFADSDLIGIPWRFIVSSKTGEQVEVKKRSEKESKLVPVESAVALLHG
jgi:prolyl-tRNA synthetase